MNKFWTAHLAVILVSLIYAANYTIAKEVMPTYLQPFGFILMRVTTGLIGFLLVHSLWVKEKIERKDLGLLALCGLFGVAVNQMMFFKGLNFTTPIHAALIMTTTPVLVLVASSILIKERITIKKIIGIVLGATGAILLIAYGQDVSLSGKGLWGDLFIFINATSYGIYLVLVKRLIAKYNPLTVVKWVFIFGWFVVFPFGIKEVVYVDWASFPFWIWIAVAYVLIFVTIFAYLLNAFALKTLNPSVVSTYIYLQPLLASSIALLAGKDKLTPVMVAAAVLIFLGVYLVSSRKSAPAGKLSVGK